MKNRWTIAVATVTVLGALAVGVALAHRMDTPARPALAPVDTVAGTDPTTIVADTVVSSSTSVADTVPATSTTAAIVATTATRPVLAAVPPTTVVATTTLPPTTTVFDGWSYRIGTPCDPVGSTFTYLGAVVLVCGTDNLWQRA